MQTYSLYPKSHVLHIFGMIFYIYHSYPSMFNSLRQQKTKLLSKVTQHTQTEINYI